MAGTEADRRDFLRWLAATGWVPSAGDEIVLITGATLVDGTAAGPRRDVTIVLVGDRIAWLGPLSALPSHDGVKVLDGRGKFVVPGLWDMHTHGSDTEDTFPPLHLANGVTGIREMWGYAENRATREKVESGRLLGPRVVLASSVLDGPVTLLSPPVTLVSGEREARAAVRTAKSEGAAFVKVYSYLLPDAFHAIADECRAQGLPFAGHLPFRVSMPDASDAGQHAFEHLFGLPMHTASNAPAYLAKLAATPMEPGAPRNFFNTARELDRLAMLEHDPVRAGELYRRLRANDSWQSPTLIVNHVIGQPAETYQDDPRLKYLPAWIRDLWADRIHLYTPVTEVEIAQQVTFFELRQRLVGDLYRAGVGILAGTDCLNPYSFPGFSLHDELELLAGCGLTPLEVLKTATADAARFLGRERIAGTVAVGKEADLLLLDADPAASVGNLRKIDTVITRGRVLDRGALDRMLADVESAAAQRPVPAAVTRAEALPADGCC